MTVCWTNDRRNTTVTLWLHQAHCQSLLPSWSAIKLISLPDQYSAVSFIKRHKSTSAFHRVSITLAPLPSITIVSWSRVLRCKYWLAYQALVFHTCTGPHWTKESGYIQCNNHYTRKLIPSQWKLGLSCVAAVLLSEDLLIHGWILPKQDKVP